MPNLMIRIDDDSKDRIQRAARAAGQSMTAFVLEHVMQAVLKQEKKAGTGRWEFLQSLPIHSYFKGLCLEATHGGTNGWAHVGYTLAQIQHDHCPPWIDDDIWNRECVGRLRALLEAGDDVRVFDWFVEHQPSYMSPVPRRRRTSFVRGVRAAYKDEEDHQFSTWLESAAPRTSCNHDGPPE